MIKLDNKLIGARIRTARKQINMTQQTLAERINLSVTHVSNIENGNTSTNLQTLFTIADVLETKFEYLICDYLNSNQDALYIEIAQLFNDCNSTEKNALLALLKKNKEVIRSLKL